MDNENNCASLSPNKAITTNTCLSEWLAKVCACSHTQTDTSVQPLQDSWVPKLTEPASTLWLCHIYSLRSICHYRRAKKVDKSYRVWRHTDTSLHFSTTSSRSAEHPWSSKHGWKRLTADRIFYLWFSLHFNWDLKTDPLLLLYALKKFLKNLFILTLGPWNFNTTLTV